jgi:hypothetical protein
MELNLGQISSIATGFNQGRLDYTPSECSLYANLAMAEVATRVQHQPLQSIAVSSTTSGERRISLPGDFGSPINVTLSGNSVGPIGVPLQLVAREVTWLDSAATALGIPRDYALFGTWMEIAPSPDSSYSIQLRYEAKIRPMVASTDTPGLNERFHMAIAYKTAEMLAAARNDLDQEAVSRGRYLSYMQSTPSDLAYRQRAQEGMAVSIQRTRR